MICTVESNIVKLVTDIPAEYANGRKLQALNENKEPVYEVKVTDEPYISKFGLGCNTVIDGKLAVICTVDIGTPVEDIKKKFGLAVVAANAYIPVITNAVETEQALIDSVFEVVGD